MEKQVNVLVVDDSAFSRRTITNMLESASWVKVVGTAADGEEAIRKTLQLKPDIITLDMGMPKMDGFSFLRVMMNLFPTPTIVISSMSDDKNVFKALELGAVDFIAKPTKYTSIELLDIKDELLTKLSMAGQVRMERVRPDISEPERKREKVQTEITAEKFALVAIGASTGGPNAIQSVLSRLPYDLYASVVISQHMPPGFIRSFAARLDKLSALEVREAEEGDEVRPGNVLICPGGYHMTFVRRGGVIRVSLKQGDDSERYVPSIDMMFNSAADNFGAHTVGVVMTGMGDDGKEGVVSVKGKGGRTIAQSEETSVIFGMPREAIKTGMVDKILPLEIIADGIVSMCKLIKSA